MTNTESKFTLRSGRTVAVHELGAPTGSGASKTIVFFHAAPGAGNFDPDPVETKARNVRIIALDRPGYGGSEPVSNGDWASIDRAVDDTVEVLERRGIDHVNVVGWSAGGREALAMAARFPDLVDRVAAIATPAPDDEVPWVPDDQRAGLEAMRGQPADEVHAALADSMSAMVPADPFDPGAVAVLGGGPADEPALSRDGTRERVATMLTEAFAQGATGMAADVAGYALRPWGFEPRDVRQKALLIYGAQDKLAGARHGRWWQERLPDARLEMVPDAGHLVVVPMWKRVMSFLAPSR